MYKGYFGLKESPFSIAPNPQFLFMSDRHKEALAHLSYGLGETGGFALLTGEVGTGKTTISRRLMEQLPENTQAACILNPTLSSQELLATICDELKIRYRKTGATLKSLTDKIHEKLNKNHKEALNTLLIIDEAQHLLPEVLEQLRLLTNLETDTKKLLQVILIGQPELKQLLQRRDLRQLAQRITARYHLMPLTKIEVGLYIKHRLSVAQCNRQLFEKSAITEIHRISQGIPRIINLLCERSLTNAYCSNNALVTKKIVLLSAQEALGDEYKAKFWWQHIAIKTLAASAIFTGIIFGSYYVGHFYGEGTSDKAIVNLSETKKLQPAMTPESTRSKNVDKQPIETPITLVNNVVADVVIDEPPKEFEIISDGDSKRAVELSADNVAMIGEVTTNGTSANDSLTELADDKTKPKAKDKFSVAAVEGVSDDLLSRFQSAIDDTEQEASIASGAGSDKRVEITVPTLADMPTWLQNDLPSLSFEQHIYTSEGDSWVKVNGRERYEGDKITDKLVLNYIYAQKVVLTFKGEKFSMPALSTW
ncbi:MAG: AAA family ATPase [Colwellia sp.]|nr:AAA family ATPase [Colwellia sp.]